MSVKDAPMLSIQQECDHNKILLQGTAIFRLNVKFWHRGRRFYR